MAFDATDAPLVVMLTADEAMTVLAALRQYEPYWRSTDSPAEIAERLQNLRLDIESVIGKIKWAALAEG